uniref:LsmAD domain-containing protein n=1 Tax=Panagrolaimus sp. ES5 TaxID=591445 RepID=A0AC34G7Q0_9BILA
MQIYANKLAHDVFNSVSFDEEVSADYKASEKEDSIIKELLKIFEQDKIQSNELSKEKWDSVFWDDIFTRPDIQTSFLNQTMLYNDNTKHFKFDHEKADLFKNSVTNAHANANKNSFSLGGMLEGFGLNFGFSHGEKKSNSNSQDTEKKSKDNINVDDFNKALEKKNWNVKWTGEKFEQKSFDLYRVNTKDLHSATEQAFNRVVVSKEQSGQQIDIQVETNAVGFGTGGGMRQNVVPQRRPVQNGYGGGYNPYAYRAPAQAIGYGSNVGMRAPPSIYRNPPIYRNPMQYRNPPQYGYGANVGMRPVSPVQYRNPYAYGTYYPYRAG